MTIKAVTGFRVWQWLTAMLVMLSLSGCGLQLISTYDERSVEQMERLSMAVERFYTTLDYSTAKERTYKKYKSAYIDIHVRLQILLASQQARPLNELTVKQVKIFESLWQEDEASHKKNDTISNFIIERRQQQYRRIFQAMITGEESKAKPGVN